MSNTHPTSARTRFLLKLLLTTHSLCKSPTHWNKHYKLCLPSLSLTFPLSHSLGPTATMICLCSLNMEDIDSLKAIWMVLLIHKSAKSPSQYSLDAYRDCIPSPPKIYRHLQPNFFFPPLLILLFYLPTSSSHLQDYKLCLLLYQWTSEINLLLKK